MMPTFKESPYGFEDRKNSVYHILHQKYGDAVRFSIGDDLDGVVIPSENLKPSENSAEHGLNRYIARFTYETLSNGDLDVIPRLVRIPGHENRFMLREELILHYIPLILTGIR